MSLYCSECCGSYIAKDRGKSYNHGGDRNKELKKHEK